MKKRKKSARRKPMAVDGYAVVQQMGDKSFIIRQIALHRDALRCFWGIGESIVYGQFVFTESPFSWGPIGMKQEDYDAD